MAVSLGHTVLITILIDENQTNGTPASERLGALGLPG